MNNSTITDAIAEEESPASWENWLAACICFLFSGTCMLLTVWVAVLLLRLESMRTQFSYLCVSLACADLTVLSSFTFWVTPMTILQDLPLSSSRLGLRVGSFGIFGYIVSIWSILVIAVNRFLAIFFPIRYQVWFNTKRTLYLISACWLLGAFCAAFTIPDGCSTFYDPAYYSWMYELDRCGQSVQFWMDFVQGTVMGIIIFIVNTITVWRMRKGTKVS